jgi:hypothetical protein
MEHSMADIYKLRAADCVRREPIQRRVDGDCEIILFPGVRYERWADAPSEAPKKSTSARKSRTKKQMLEMAD